ncbi:hypothetical protein P775_15330 [Puniceibacterium antarcticum]|uniref:Uncharacterized protein n=1 Tax=Puniceibacterium antarcticum TaxID=1206336 RepID=A0A2G8RCI9_9RHOB|nr:hypothetical protein P775_15330 [Puniceibacterium antarcticum]
MLFWQLVVALNDRLPLPQWINIKTPTDCGGLVLTLGQNLFREFIVAKYHERQIAEMRTRGIIFTQIYSTLPVERPAA